MRLSEQLGVWSRRLRNLLVPREQFDHDLEDEMRLHRDLRSREFQDTGTEPDEARKQLAVFKPVRILPNARPQHSSQRASRNRTR